MNKTEIFFDRATGDAVKYSFASCETSGSYINTTKKYLQLRVG